MGHGPRCQGGLRGAASLPGTGAMGQQNSGAEELLRFPFLLQGWMCLPPPWGKASGPGSSWGPSVDLAPLFLRLVIGAALCTCIMMDKVAPAPLLLVVPALMLLPQIKSDLCLNPEFPRNFQHSFRRKEKNVLHF